MFLWPDPADLSAPDVIRHRARWSADFPHPVKQGATTWLTWGLHHNMFENFLEGEDSGILVPRTEEESLINKYQWGGQNHLCILKYLFELARNEWRNTLGIKIITKTRKTE